MQRDKRRTAIVVRVWDKRRTAVVVRVWDNVKEILEGYPEGARGTQYASNWARFTSEEQL